MTKLFNFLQPNDNDLTGYTLIVPSVSIGNIPQLTVDLLIASYGCRRAATIWHPAIVPSVGGDPFDPHSTTLSTACELYVNHALRLAIIQLRSAIHSKLTTKFIADFHGVLTAEIKPQNVIIVSSAFDYELRPGDDKFYYLSNDETDIAGVMAAAGVKALVKHSETGKYVMSGSGFARKLFDELTAGRVPSTLLVKYASEGDNRPDAVQTVEVLRDLVSSLKNLVGFEIKFPVSWEFVFGGPPPLGMY